MSCVGGDTEVSDVVVPNRQREVAILDSFTSSGTVVIPRHQSLVGRVAARAVLLRWVLMLRRVAMKVLLPP